jgi:hypothetical protein
VETLNRHSRSVGNDPLRASGQSFRGQRVFCSNRGRRGGCGRTFSLVLADILPRHTMTASLLWRWLVEVMAGLSFKAAAEKLRLPFALETVYRLRRGLRQCLASVRTRLSGNNHRQQVGRPTRCCKPWNICGRSFLIASVRQRHFNSIFSVRFWVEAATRKLFWPNCHTTFARGGFCLRAATRQSSAGSDGSAGSVAGVNKNHSAHRPNAGAGNFKNSTHA